MSMNVGGSKGGAIADINVTPMADIMIVLLIIFMVITPMLQKGVDVRLPLAGNTKERKDEQKTITVAISKDTATYLGGTQMANQAELVPQVKERLEDLPGGPEDRLPEGRPGAAVRRGDEGHGPRSARRASKRSPSSPRRGRRARWALDTATLPRCSSRRRARRGAHRPRREEAALDRPLPRGHPAQARRGRVGHQHHAAHRRDAGAADHLHGGDAADPEGPGHRAAPGHARTSPSSPSRSRATRSCSGSTRRG